MLMMLSLVSKTLPGHLMLATSTCRRQNDMHMSVTVTSLKKAINIAQLHDAATGTCGILKRDGSSIVCRA